MAIIYSKSSTEGSDPFELGQGAGDAGGRRRGRVSLECVAWSVE